MAQCGGPTLSVLGSLCEGGSLLTETGGASVGGFEALADATGPVCVVIVGLSAVPDTAELAAPRQEADLLGGCRYVFLTLGKVVSCSPLPLCFSENHLMASSCSSGALSGNWPITMYRSVRKLI